MSAAKTVDPKLVEFATPRQTEIIGLVNEAGGFSKAERDAGVSMGLFSRSILALKKRAARMGYAPNHWEDGTAPGYLMGKVTVQRANGVVERTWERQSPEHAERVAAVKAAVDAYIGDVVVPLHPAPAMPNRSTDIIPWINIGDGHIGMLAHEAESGANFDLEIAERELCAAISILIDETPACERLVINDLGDMTHRENRAGETTHSRNKLDCAGTFDQMVRTYSRVMRFIVEKALTKAQTVDFIGNKGNHDDTNQVFMGEILRAAYGHTGRVNVLDNQSRFVGYRMGKTLVMTHHSDTCKPEKLVDVMADDFAEDWGETVYRYVDVGHLHHAFTRKEHGGALVECWNTLAPKDAWGAWAGHRGRQTISIVDRSRTYGEVGRRVLPIERIRDVIAVAQEREGRPVTYAPPVKRAFAA